MDYKQEVADRLLKLLMISRINKIPLSVVDKLKWAMGLPQDYVKTIVPEFPDYVSPYENAQYLSAVKLFSEIRLSLQN